MSENREVVVRDISMSFGSMVVFMVKWALASIPALIIIALVLSVIGAVFAGIFGTMFGIS